MFCISGKGPVISVDLFPVIELQGDYEVGLISFTTYNSIPNIEENVNNLIHFGKQTIAIPTGSYEINDINEFVQRHVAFPDEIIIKANNNTLKTEIKSSQELDFTREHSIAPLLGFSPRKLEPHKWHRSDNPVVIIKVDTIRVGCNIARGSYQNETEGHVIHEFAPAVPPGFKIVERPHNVIYLPLSVDKLQNITITITDQNKKLINLRGETVDVTLNIRPKSHGSRDL